MKSKLEQVYSSLITFAMETGVVVDVDKKNMKKAI